MACAKNNNNKNLYKKKLKRNAYYSYLEASSKNTQREKSGFLQYTESKALEKLHASNLA